MTTWPLYRWHWELQYLRRIHHSPSAKCTSIIGDSSAHKLCLKLCERISWKTILSHLELQNSFYVKTFQGAQNTAALCGAEWGLCFCRGIYNSVCLVMQQIKVDLHFIINFLFILRTAQATVLALRHLSVLDLYFSQCTRRMMLSKGCCIGILFSHPPLLLF